MKEMIIVISTFLFLILILMLILIAKNFSKKQQIKSNTGIYLLDIDFKNSRLKKTNLVPNMDNDWNDEYFDDGWMNIDSFLAKLSSENQEKILSAFDIIKLNNQYIKFNIKNSTLKEKNYSIQWVIEFFKINDSFNAVIQWSYIKNIPAELKIITPEEIFKNNFKYNSFIAFKLKSENNKDFKSFISILFNVIKNKNMNFFILKNIVILIIYSDTSEKADKKTNAILKKIDKLKVTKQLNCYYNSIGIVESNGIYNSNDLSKVITRIYFSLIKSSQLNKTFYFKIQNIFFNEFEEFKDNYLTINEIIKSNAISTKKIPILSTKTNTTIANYLKPDFKFPDNFWANQIINSNHILPNLQDVYFEKILNILDKDDQYLIDVNDYLLIQNIDKLSNYKSIIFIIEFQEIINIQSIELIISNLKLKNIKFGIKIKNIIPEIITLIEIIMPHAIIIDKSLINDNDLIKFLNLNQIIFLCEKNPATLIYENPSDFELSKNKIKYHYNDK